MFITKEAIAEMTGVTVDQPTLATANMMIEAYIGKSESEIYDAGDRSVLGRATAFQAAYINGQSLDILEQVAIKKQTVGATNTDFDTNMMAPYMSPWAVMSCKGLSWMKTKSVHTGPIFDYAAPMDTWRRY